MAIGIRAEVFAGFLRVKCPPAAKCGAFHTILHAGFATAVFMDMETMYAGPQGFQVRGTRPGHRRITDRNEPMACGAPLH